MAMGAFGEPREPPPSPYILPDPLEIEPGHDIVALGADLAPGTLLAAYRAGLFPMPIDPRRRRSKLAWYSPDPRGIIPLDGLVVSKSLRASCRKYDTRIDTDFRGVMERCADPGREGRWITTEFIDAYVRLAELGWAHSVETYLDDELVGGLYGISVNRFFAGESMFHTATDASKVALVHLVDALNASGAELLDTQWLTPHLASLGGIEVERPHYLELLARAITPDPPATSR